MNKHKKKPVLPLPHASSQSKYRAGVSGKITTTFNPCMPKKTNKYCKFDPTNLGLFVHIPGEGDGVVGDFFNVADRVEALLVISCGGHMGGGHGSFQV